MLGLVSLESELPIALGTRQGVVKRIAPGAYPGEARVRGRRAQAGRRGRRGRAGSGCRGARVRDVATRSCCTSRRPRCAPRESRPEAWPASTSAQARSRSSSVRSIRERMSWSPRSRPPPRRCSAPTRVARRCRASPSSPARVARRAECARTPSSRARSRSRSPGSVRPRRSRSVPTGRSHAPGIGREARRLGHAAGRGHRLDRPRAVALRDAAARLLRERSRGPHRRRRPRARRRPPRRAERGSRPRGGAARCWAAVARPHGSDPR